MISKSMIPNEQIRLLDAWKTNIFAELSISEIMMLSKKQTKTWVFNTLKLLTQKKLLNQKTKGNINLYSLNLENPFTQQILHYLEVQNNLNFPQIKIISELIDKTPIINYSLIVFGSYANNTHKQSSDIDICFLVENKDTEKKIKPFMNDIKLNHTTQIDEHYITFNDFTAMLLREEENLGKQIYKKHKIFYNPDIYYRLLKKAHKNGFSQ